jgi:hypothetical protein
MSNRRRGIYFTLYALALAPLMGTPSSHPSIFTKLGVQGWLVELDVIYGRGRSLNLESFPGNARIYT